MRTLDDILNITTVFSKDLFMIAMVTVSGTEVAIKLDHGTTWRKLNYNLPVTGSWFPRGVIVPDDFMTC